ncbi:hypothetical protein ONZ45_g2444 [Pleurotus djamor]|nr:hypothetical protein ONZ45_g2444 [Pleurotus djamor]
MKWQFTSLLLYATVALAVPANDWSKPCFNGECAYDIHPSTGNTGFIKLSGAGITDITPAAGWVILDCDPHSMEQEIRLVCSNTNHEEAGCNHVFDNGGADHKVVRLPESCTDAPFLRIASARVDEDQSIPGHAASKITKRDGINPTVHILRVDSDWAASDVSKVGAVTFSFIGSNNPDINMMNARAFSTIDKPSAMSKAPSRVSKRSSNGLFDWVKNTFHEIKETVVTAVNTVANAVSGAVKSTVSHLKGSLISSSRTALTSFQINPEWIKDVKLDTQGKMHEVYHLEKEHAPTCQSTVAGDLKVSAGGMVDAHVKFGLTANGSVIPPHLGSYAIYAIVDGDVDATLEVVATLTGHIHTKRAEIVSAAITPLQIPKIIELGPSVRLEAQAELDLSLEVTITTHLKYHVDHLEFWFPKKLSEDNPEAKSGSKSVDLKPAPVDISATAEINAQANITAHLIPSLHLGLTALGNQVKATGYIEVDAFARLALEARGSAQASHHPRELASVPVEHRDRGYVPPYLGSRALDNTSASFKGCLGIYAGLVIRAGAEGALAGFEAKPFTWDIFTLLPEISIFHTCWPLVTKRAEVSYAPVTSLERRTDVKEEVKCGVGKPTKAPSVHTPEKKLH